jgi:4-hydroxy-3-polyprenylbenzoate decarboxylase
VDLLLERGSPVIASASSAARIVWNQELDESFGAALERWDETGRFTFHPAGRIDAPIASGSVPAHGMAVVPCSMATLAAIAHGLADNLIRRAADVCLKERRPLVLVPRETPLSAIHLENMLKMARLGVTILPPEPPFYMKPGTMDEIVDHIAHRVIGALGLSESLPPEMRYQAPNGDRPNGVG